jgi:hypothetical protein
MVLRHVATDGADRFALVGIDVDFHCKRMVLCPVESSCLKTRQRDGLGGTEPAAGNERIDVMPDDSLR